MVLSLLKAKNIFNHTKIYKEIKGFLEPEKEG